MRLFVAAWPPDEVLDRVEALDRPEVAGLRWTTRDQWHVTLRFLGTVDEPGPVVDALASMDARAAEAVMGPVVGRFGQRVLHVPVAGLEAVAEAVLWATRHLGQPPDERPFAGHLTLARARDRRFRVDLRPLAGTPLAGRWPVGEVCLVESRLSPKGARYEVVERFLLR